MRSHYVQQLTPDDAVVVDTIAEYYQQSIVLTVNGFRVQLTPDTASAIAHALNAAADLYLGAP